MISPTTKQSATSRMTLRMRGCPTLSGRWVLTGFTRTCNCVNAFATSSTASHAGSTKITPPRRVALRKVSSCFMVLVYFTRLIGGGASLQELVVEVAKRERVEG